MEKIHCSLTSCCQNQNPHGLDAKAPSIGKVHLKTSSLTAAILKAISKSWVLTIFWRFEMTEIRNQEVPHNFIFEGKLLISNLQKNFQTQLFLIAFKMTAKKRRSNRRWRSPLKMTVVSSSGLFLCLGSYRWGSNPCGFWFWQQCVGGQWNFSTNFVFKVCLSLTFSHKMNVSLRERTYPLYSTSLGCFCFSG